MIDESKLASAFSGLDWPATRQTIWDKAKENNADDETMESLQGISDMEYADMDALKKELGMGMEEEGGMGEEM